MPRCCCRAVKKALMIGAGSGYTAAVPARIAGDVHVIEPRAEIAEKAAARLIDIGITTVHMLHDGDIRGWQEDAPFDVILAPAARPFVPQSLKSQVVPGGRLVAPVGPTPQVQKLVRYTRCEKGQFVQEDLGDLQIVPPSGDAGQPAETAAPLGRASCA